MTRTVVDALEFQATAEVRDGSLEGFRRLDQRSHARNGHAARDRCAEHGRMSGNGPIKSIDPHGVRRNSKLGIQTTSGVSASSDFCAATGGAGSDMAGARCRKSRPAWVRPAPASLGLPVKRLTFLAIVIAEAFGTLAGRRGFALRFAGEAAVAAAVAVLEAVVDAGRPRRCRRRSVDRHQRHARSRNRRSQPVDSAQFHSPLVRPLLT